MERKPWLRSTEFLRAIDDKNYTRVNLMLDAGFDIDTYLICNRTAVSICAWNGWYEMAQLLMKQGCSLSLKTEKGETPLHLAVLKSDYNLVKLLLKNRADLTSVDLLQKTALHYACEMNNLKIASLLLTGSNSATIVNMQDKDRKTPLLYACRFGSKDIISLILSNGAEVKRTDSYRNGPLIHVMSNQQCSAEIITLLLDAGADINQLNSFEETPLINTLGICSMNCMHNLYEKYQKLSLLLIAKGCDVNLKSHLGESPLHLAVTLRDKTLVHKLLNAGCEVNATNSFGFTPLFYAVRKGDAKISQLLLDAGANLKFIRMNNPEWPLFDSQKDESLLSSFLLLQLFNRAANCPSLQNQSRIIIRKSLPNSIDESALLLPLPKFLIKFVMLS